MCAIVCATNRDPWEEVRAGRLREDLYYRLHVVPCAMPPLRERNGDLVLLARHFLALYAAEEGKSFTDFAPDAIAALQAHGWPGNIRELQNVLRNVVLFHDGTLVTAAMLARLDGGAGPRTERQPGWPGRAGAASGRRTEPRRAVKTAVAGRERGDRTGAGGCGGNVPRAAALLEVNPSTIYRRKAEWDRERRVIGLARRV